MGYPTYRHKGESESGDEYRDRANAAEADLFNTRSELWEFIQWLSDGTRGPVIFRSEVVERLSQILDT